ncbi:NTP transferase domain-containing protein [Spirosoma soli]|uniref:NTP transferase domain-containing protein n=1 Tax=Spirosoma soli TaxID=1770529 RepID=A0ABW5MBG6_9BACT
MNVATIILAAGASTRLGGELKQLLTYNGKSLVRRITEEALLLQAGSAVVVVLGANHERIAPELADLPVTMPINADWSEGLASSLRMGLASLDAESIDAFLVLLTDQPYVTVDLLRQLIATQQQTGKGIVACRYAEPSHLGVPALFNARYKSIFMDLKGDTGARKLIQQFTADCAEVPFPLAAVDLDTQEDVAKWREAEG